MALASGLFAPMARRIAPRIGQGASRVASAGRANAGPLLVRTFAGSGEGDTVGSLVAMRLEDSPSPSARCRDLTIQDTATSNSTCTVFATPIGPSRFAVRWYSAQGTEYKCCGHGSMALGFAAYKHWGIPEDSSLELVNDNSPTIEMDLDDEEEMVSMRLSTKQDTVFDATATEVDEALCDALGLEPCEVTFQGKWSLGVVALTSAARVLELRPDFEKLCQVDARNVIVAAFDRAEAEEDAKAHDFIYRVFCPRLGVPEDAATGTSMAVVSELFSKMFGCEGRWLRGLQASSSPSELHAKFCRQGTRQGSKLSPSIWLRGQCVHATMVTP